MSFLRLLSPRQSQAQAGPSSPPRLSAAPSAPPRSEAVHGASCSASSPPPIPVFYPYIASPPTSPGGPGKSNQPTIAIHVPAYGVVRLNAPPIPVEPDRPAEDHLFKGELQVRLPRGSGRKRCKRIKVWMEGLWEDLDAKGVTVAEMVYYSRGGEIDGGVEGVWLDERSSRLEWVIPIPSNLPPHDFHAAGRLFYYIHAVVEGMPELPDTSGNGNSSPSPPLQPRSRSTSPTRDTSPYGFSPSPIPGVAELSLSISGGLEQTGSVLQLPSYEEQAEAAATEDGGWLRGTFKSKRRLQLGYLPSPTGGVTPFEDRLSQDVPGLGTVDIRVQVDEFAVGAFFPLRLSAFALSPKATIFALRVRLLQTRTVTSPITSQSTTTKQNLVVLQHGEVPLPGHNHPGKESSAVWRGKDAGGKDSADYRWEGMGRVPTDFIARSTTLPGIYPPIRNSHVLSYEVFFSVHGEYADGKPMSKPWPGALRVMKRTMPILLPTCGAISKVIDLPTYSSTVSEDTLRIDANQPCPICRVRPMDHLCITCPGRAIPHVRHDRPLGDPEKKRFDPKTQDCPLCAGKSVLPVLDGYHHFCACEMPEEDAVWPVWREDVDATRPSEEESAVIKQAAERGTSRLSGSSGSSRPSRPS